MSEPRPGENDRNHPENPDSDSGASFTEYAAVILLVAGITAVVMTTGIGSRVADGIENALCRVAGRDDCATPDPNAAGEPDPTASSPFLWEGVEEHPDKMGAEQEPSDEMKKLSGDEVERVREKAELLREYTAPTECAFWDFFGCGGEPAEIDLSDMNGREIDALMDQLTDAQIKRLLSDNMVRSQGRFHEEIMDRASVATLDRIGNIMESSSEWGRAQPDLAPAAEKHGLDLGLKRVEGAQLYGDNGQPSMMDIDQGALGDCWWLASMGAVAEKTPEQIKDMIQDNGDGTYTVTFPDGKKVRVDDRFAWNRETDEPAFANPADETNPVIWPMILEKAYAQKKGGDYTDIEAWFAHYGMQDVAGGDSDTIISPVEEFKDVSLGDFGEEVTEANREERERALLKAQRNDEAIVAATYAREIAPEDIEKKYSKVEPPIVPNHQYVVEEIDPESGEVRLRNPHDMSISTVLSSEEFYELFPMVHTNTAGR